MLEFPGILCQVPSWQVLAECELLKGRVAVGRSYVPSSGTGLRVHWARCWISWCLTFLCTPAPLPPASIR